MSAPSAMDERWMRRALALARRGEGLAHPNPLVGAVLVRGGRVVAEGFHTWEGLHHAETLAIARAGARARGSTLYVTLEPCSHTGRTGPCADAVIAAGIRRVVAALPDPNPLVSGMGFRRLRRAGVEVVVGAGQAEARRLNEDFALWIRRHRPFLTLKTAATLDGQLALAPPGRRTRFGRAAERWITSETSRRYVQRLRHAADAVLTGIGTVLADDPLLTDRTGRRRARPLLRVVVDSQLRLPPRSRLARTAKGDVLVFTLRSERAAQARRLLRRGVRLVRVPARAGRLDLPAVLAELARMGVLHVLVEAGPTLNGALLAGGYVDKAVLFYSPRILGRAALPLARLPAPRARSGARRERSRAGSPPLAALSGLRLLRFGPDFAVEGYLRHVYRNR